MSSERDLATSSRQAHLDKLPPDKEVSMECESLMETIKTLRTSQHIVKLIFNEEFNNVQAEIDKVKKIICEVVGGNCLQIYTNIKMKSISFCFESEAELNKFCEINLSEYDVQTQIKKLTNNPELDLRKVKLSRAAGDKQNAMDVHDSIKRFGDIEEFYENGIRGTGKRSFIIAFKDMESKKRLLCHENIYCGKKLLRVSDYDLSFVRSEVQEKEPALRITNFSNGLNEYVVKDLMKTMQAVYWYMPISKKGHRMKCINVIFSNTYQKDRVKNSKWQFEGRNLIVAEINEQLCFVCGVKDHMVSQCPKRSTSTIRQSFS